MEHRAEFAGRLEVAALQQEEDVGRERRDGDQALREVLKLARHHPPPGQRQGAERNEEQGRQNAACAALVEAEQCEPVQRQFVSDDARNQVAADDEEDVDTDEAAAERGDARVEEKHR